MACGNHCILGGNRNISLAIPSFVSASVLPPICFILKQYVLLCKTYLPFCASEYLWTLHLFIRPSFIQHEILCCWQLYVLINQDWVFDLIRFPFSEQSYGIAWSLTYANLGKYLLKNNFYLQCVVVRMIKLRSQSSC